MTHDWGRHQTWISHTPTRSQIGKNPHTQLWSIYAKYWVTILSPFSCSKSYAARGSLYVTLWGCTLTSWPLMSVYRTHFPRRGRQYSNKYASANSTPWPFPNLPCVSVAVMTWTECRSISSHSFGSFVIWFLGHQAPPWLSVRRLKQIRNTLENVFYIPMFSLQLGKR